MPKQGLHLVLSGFALNSFNKPACNLNPARIPLYTLPFPNFNFFFFLGCLFWISNSLLFLFKSSPFYKLSVLLLLVQLTIPFAFILSAPHHQTPFLEFSLASPPRISSSLFSIRFSSRCAFSPRQSLSSHYQPGKKKQKSKNHNISRQQWRTQQLTAEAGQPSSR